MKIALIGYGKMGREIESIAQQRQHDVVLRATTHAPFQPRDLAGCDVAIEFTRPEAAAENILKCFEANCPVVVGTTGWYMRLPEIRNEALGNNQSLLYATNFSIGVNVLFHLNRELARIMSTLNEYKPHITEIHHTAKLDKPSGTAITLAEGIMEQNADLKQWVLDSEASPRQLPIHSLREGQVPGTHTIEYKSAVDSLQLKHEAFNRKGFALGAVKAAEWLPGRKGIFTMNDFLKF